MEDVTVELVVHVDGDTCGNAGTGAAGCKFKHLFPLAPYPFWAGARIVDSNRPRIVFDKYEAFLGGRFAPVEKKSSYEGTESQRT